MSWDNPNDNYPPGVSGADIDALYGQDGAPEGETCGTCGLFEWCSALCRLNGFETRAEYPACEGWEP